MSIFVKTVNCWSRIFCQTYSNEGRISFPFDIEFKGDITPACLLNSFQLLSQRKSKQKAFGSKLNLFIVWHAEKQRLITNIMHHIIDQSRFESSTRFIMASMLSVIDELTNIHLSNWFLRPTLLYTDMIWYQSTSCIMKEFHIGKWETRLYNSHQ